MKKTVCALLALLLIAGCIAGCGKAENNGGDTVTAISWRADTTGKYAGDSSVRSLICVQATDTTNARLLLFEKTVENGKTVWTMTLETGAYIGKNGLGKEKEGDGKTPKGDFGITQAFGIKANPGTALPYTDVTEDIYCCGDSNCYNQIIDIREHPHDCSDGEHLIDYSPEYNYGIFVDYNRDGTPGLGSAIFLHCKGANTYTGGCIAVDEEAMVQILQAADENTRIIIDYSPLYKQ